MRNSVREQISVPLLLIQTNPYILYITLTSPPPRPPRPPAAPDPFLITQIPYLPAIILSSAQIKSSLFFPTATEGKVFWIPSLVCRWMLTVDALIQHALNRPVVHGSDWWRIVIQPIKRRTKKWQAHKIKLHRQWRFKGTPRKSQTNEMNNGGGSVTGEVSDPTSGDLGHNHTKQCHCFDFHH